MVTIHSVTITFPCQLMGNAKEEITLTGILHQGETVENAIIELRNEYETVASKPNWELYNEKCKLEIDIKDLSLELANLKQHWDAMAQFLRVQGINPNAPFMPLTLLQPSQPVEVEFANDDGNYGDK